MSIERKDSILSALLMIRKIDDNQSNKNRRKMAGWDDEALCNILSKIKCV